MSKFTLQLRWYVENGGEVFDFDYPIFDESYRPILEQKIIDHYYFREIGLETIGQFKHFLKSRMNTIMPYYNQLYKSEKDFEKQDPYVNKNLTQTDTRTALQDSHTKINSESSNQSDTTNQEIYSDTPQARLNSNLDYAT